MRGEYSDDYDYQKGSEDWDGSQKENGELEYEYKKNGVEYNVSVLYDVTILENGKDYEFNEFDAIIFSFELDENGYEHEIFYYDDFYIEKNKHYDTSVKDVKLVEEIIKDAVERITDCKKHKNYL